MCNWCIGAYLTIKIAVETQAGRRAGPAEAEVGIDTFKQLIFRGREVGMGGKCFSKKEIYLVCFIKMFNQNERIFFVRQI